ncbi:hypothetical protein [Finegoldia magna]|uniref:hypothetical protein n=1 Tax=Finegoldia magna TaxID=1260 RepID=UPI00290B3385|nr:hypothetical protein [Finegoldia magna]MDU4730879.1 hypothetical protein [Finegoldia magna]
MRQILILDSPTMQALQEKVNSRILKDNIQYVRDIQIKNISDRWIAFIIYDKSYNQLRSDNNVRG